MNWISVNERLPELNAEVLLSGDDGTRFVGKLMEFGGSYLCFVPTLQKTWSWALNSVTHWAPITPPGQHKP